MAKLFWAEKFKELMLTEEGNSNKEYLDNVVSKFKIFCEEQEKELNDRLSQQ